MMWRVLIRSSLIWLLGRMLLLTRRVMLGSFPVSHRPVVLTLNSNGYTVVFWRDSSPTQSPARVLPLTNLAGPSTSSSLRWMPLRTLAHSGNRGVECGAVIHEGQAADTTRCTSNGPGGDSS